MFLGPGQELQLASYLQIPCHELDAVGYEGGAGAERLLEVRLADIAQIAAQPAWQLPTMPGFGAWG